MTAQLQILNRQRQVKVNMSSFKKAAAQIFKATLENLKEKPVEFLSKTQLDCLNENGILSVALVSNKEIQKLNKQWRGKDYATDVLSFELTLEPELLGIPFEFGELVISAQKAEEQAAEYGHSFERELAFLFVHGLLHVLGFDHESKKEEKEMFGRQKEILSLCGFKRE